MLCVRRIMVEEYFQSIVNVKTAVIISIVMAGIFTVLRIDVVRLVLGIDQMGSKSSGGADQ